jgi:hypothetical protein
MSRDSTFPDQIAGQAASMVSPATPELQEKIRVAVLQAFGCTSPEHTCPVHGTPLRPDRYQQQTQHVMSTRAGSWEDDPYDSYTPIERREDVQDNLRAAAEFSRSLRSDLENTLRRGRAAEEQLDQAVEHAWFNGGLTEAEFHAAETALSAIKYVLQLLYTAANHVGDQPG